jgi:hypothetical protein
MRPVLHDATVHRTAEAPGGINLRHVAQTRLAMPRGSTRNEPRTTRPRFDNYFDSSTLLGRADRLDARREVGPGAADHLANHAVAIDDDGVGDR